MNTPSSAQASATTTLDGVQAPSVRPAAVTLLSGVETTDSSLQHSTLVATGDSALAGLITFWRCDGDVNHEELTSLWSDAGGDVAQLPEVTTPAAALSHAVYELAGKRGLLARPLRPAIGPRKRGMGWALVLETARALPAIPRLAVEDPALSQAADPEAAAVALELPAPEPVEGAAVEPEETPAEVDPLTFTTVLTVRQEGGVLHVTHASHELEAELRAAYDYHLGHLTPKEMAQWLPALVYKLDGIAVRDQGGVYFLPETGRPTWQRVVQALRAVSSHRVYGIPVMRAEDTATAFLDALEREAEEFVGKAMVELPTLGERGRKHRMEETADLLQKLGRYETLFGEGRLQRVRDRVQGLTRTSTVAKLLSAPIAGLSVTGAATSQAA